MNDMFAIAKVKKSLLLFLFSCAILLANAQLTTEKKVFTRIDSLRGSLRPERTCFDVNYYNLQVDFDTINRTIVGRNAIYFTGKEASRTIQIDLTSTLVIDKIVYQNKELAYTREFNAVFISLPEPLQNGKQDSIVFDYHGKPEIAKRAPWDGGFVWSRDETNNLWLAVACEGLGASSWWPCKDYLADEPDSMQITCVVPANLQAICNGNLRKESDAGTGKKAFTWFISYPINTYNVTFNIGAYTHFGDTLRYSDGDVLSLDYYVMKYNKEKALEQFQQVKPMLLCYEKYLGKYPFMRDGYALVETPYLGMEHQGAIAYGNKYKTGYDGKDFSRIGLTFDYIIIHESGHEWWGNSVSCSDLADMWIHESFCTYTEAIYVECMYGRQRSLDYIKAKQKYVGNKAAIQGPYGVNEEGNGDMYNKGMLLLNTMRTVVNNDELWWRIIKGISDVDFKMKNTNADELINYFEAKSKLKLRPVFEQYLKYPAIPQLNYSLKKTGKKTYSFEYAWKTDVTNFEMPFIINIGEKEMRINGSNTVQTKMLKLKREQDLRINTDLLYITTNKL